jgi:hypothetical protein
MLLPILRLDAGTHTVTSSSSSSGAREMDKLCYRRLLHHGQSSIEPTSAELLRSLQILSAC